MNKITTTDILIAGAGPVGMSLALALARQKINVVVLEKLDELSYEARASTIHPPTLEFFDEIGIIEDILTSGLQIERLQFWERESRELIADFPYELIAEDTKYPFRFQCPQSTVTRIILKHMEATGYGKVLFNHEFSRFAETENGIEAVAETPASEVKFNCQYLIGCDGANSKVRENLGLGFDGKTYEDRFLLVSSDINLGELFPNMGTVAYIFDPEEWVIIMTLPDTVRLVFRLKPHENSEEAKQIENVRKRISKFLETEIEYDIKAVSTYQVHQRVTEKFRVGRAILAGDAAHINNPTGGMGMNSGIHDARDLAKVLVEIFDGEDEYLLDEYAKNRKETAVKMVQAMTDGNYKNLAESDAAMREKRNRNLREAANDSVKAREYLLKTAMLAERSESRL